MYDVVANIISHNWDNQLYGSEQQYVYYIAGALIVILTCVFVDLIYRIFGHFWSGKR